MSLLKMSYAGNINGCCVPAESRALQTSDNENEGRLKVLPAGRQAANQYQFFLLAVRLLVEPIIMLWYDM